MKRFLLALGLVLLFAGDAAACGRCGIFGRGCRFAAQSYYVAPYVAPTATQVFNFQNNYPGNLPLSAQGQSVYANAPYGYSLAAQAYSVDAAAVLSQAARLTSNAQALSSDALAGFNTTAQLQLGSQLEVAKILALGQSNAQTLQAARSESIRATITNGKLEIQRVEAEQAEGGPMPTLKLFCGKCHGLEVAQPKGSFYMGDDANVAKAMRERWFDITDRLDPNHPKAMPPKDAPQPSKEQRISIVNELQATIKFHSKPKE